jgi:hypothetical protein
MLTLAATPHAVRAALIVGGLAGAEWAAFHFAVPQAIDAATFVGLHLVAAGLLLVGVASAAGGVPPRSVGQIIAELETDPRAH